MNIILQNKKGKLSMQKLVFGCAGFDTYEKRDEYFKLLDVYYARGGRCLDTARCYCQWKENGEGISERIIGEWIQSRGIPRRELVLVTKGGFPEQGDMHASRLDREHIEADLKKSLEAFQTSYVDVYLLHRDRPDKPAETYIDILDDFIEQGKIRFGGVSNWQASRIQEANRYAKETDKNPFSVSQINFALAQTTPGLCGDDTLVCMNEEEAMFYKNSGLPVMAFASLSKGFYPKLCAGKSLSPKSEKRYKTLENIKKVPRVAMLSAEHGVSAAAVVLGYLTNHPIETAAVFGVSHNEQLNQCLEAFDLVLDDSAVAVLENM